MYSHLLLNAIDLKVGQCVLWFVVFYRSVFLKRNYTNRKNALMWILDRMHVTGVIVLIVQSLFVQVAWRNLFLYQYSVANIVSSDYTWFYFRQHKIYMTLN